MNSKTKLTILLILPVFLLGISPALGDTSLKAESILQKMDSALHPEGLFEFRCKALTEVGNVPAGESVIPRISAEVNIYYIGPYDFRVEYSAPYGTVFPEGILRLRGDDPMTLANPALKQALLAVYDAVFAGERVYEENNRISLIWPCLGYVISPGEVMGAI